MWVCGEVAILVGAEALNRRLDLIWVLAANRLVQHADLSPVSLMTIATVLTHVIGEILRGGMKIEIATALA
jgi:hypothetical protein